MFVCVRKSDGRLLEAQSDASPGTLVSNAVLAGYLANDVEEKTVTDSEYTSLLLALRPSQDERAAAYVDSFDHLQFEVMFDMENRMRTREGSAQITRTQYRAALVNRWKTLNG